MTRLCVSIYVEAIATAKRDIAEAIEAGAEMIELRLDVMTDLVLANQLVEACSVPCIVTCRAAYEGGDCELADGERAAFLSTLATAHDAYYDLELVADKRVPHSNAGRLVLSSHDFKGRPDRLYNLMEEMNARPAAVSKMAWMARSIRDCQEAFELMQSRQRPTIAQCMGEAGQISRILAKKFGGFLTFAAVREHATTAPGQPTIEQLKQVYRWDALDADTRVYGVVGSPIAHSMSPAVHNAAFAHAGINAVYVPLLVNKGYESFKAFMETYIVGDGPLQMDGLSVTIPHKENALRYLREHGDGVDIEHLARTIGAVNTIVVDRSHGKPQLAGRNTDYAAILDTITSALSIDRSALKDKRIAVIGAGGTGRTGVAALAAAGATVVVFNRTIDRAQALAREFDGKSGTVVAAPMDKLSECACDIFINTTSLGMSPNVNDSPFGEHPPPLSSANLVFDTVYNPPRTKLLQQAESRGAQTASGVDMFIHQAAAQFELWMSLPAPVDAMRQALTDRLTPPTL